MYCLLTVVGALRRGRAALCHAAAASAEDVVSSRSLLVHYGRNVQILSINCGGYLLVFFALQISKNLIEMHQVNTLTLISNHKLLF
jgi:hypothetical protein